MSSIRYSSKKGGRKNFPLQLNFFWAWKNYGLMIYTVLLAGSGYSPAM